MSSLVVFIIGIGCGLILSYGWMSAKAYHLRARGAVIPRRNVIRQSLVIWAFVVAILAGMIFAPNRGPWWIVILGGEIALILIGGITANRVRRRR